MYEEESQENIDATRIGYIAQLIDAELTIFERMKIKKTTLYKITIAILFYGILMTVFSLIL